MCAKYADLGGSGGLPPRIFLEMCYSEIESGGFRYLLYSIPILVSFSYNKPIRICMCNIVLRYCVLSNYDIIAFWGGNFSSGRKSQGAPSVCNPGTCMVAYHTHYEILNNCKL